MKEGQKSRRDGLDGVCRRGFDVIVIVLSVYCRMIQTLAVRGTPLHPIDVLFFVELALAIKAGGTEFKVDILVGLVGGAGVSCVAFVFHR